MKILLQNGADVNATDEDGFTPIHIAAYNGNLQMVKTLLQSGSDIQLDKKDNKILLLNQLLLKKLNK